VDCRSVPIGLNEPSVKVLGGIVTSEVPVIGVPVPQVHYRKNQSL